MLEKASSRRHAAMLNPLECRVPAPETRIYSSGMAAIAAAVLIRNDMLPYFLPAGAQQTLSSASIILRISNFCALPVTVKANASTTRMWRGTL